MAAERVIWPQQRTGYSQPAKVLKLVHVRLTSCSGGRCERHTNIHTGRSRISIFSAARVSKGIEKDYDKRKAAGNVKELCVLGGGAAGMYGAIWTMREVERARTGINNTCFGDMLSIRVIESKPQAMRSILLSGGGRCNVTTALCDDSLSEMHSYYPRGCKELKGGYFHSHSPQSVRDFFTTLGCQLKVEDDGRVFPSSDKASTIERCLLEEASKLGIGIILDSSAYAVRVQSDGSFQIDIKGKSRVAESETLHADYILLATGGSPSGRDLARSLGHTVVPSVPSLFTFKIEGVDLQSLAGVSVKDCHGKLEIVSNCTGVASTQIIRQIGPILVTHKGLSGPLILRLSAWGARLLHSSSYKASLCLDFAPNMNESSLESLIFGVKQNNQKKLVGTFAPRELGMPRRFWMYILSRLQIDDTMRWNNMSKSNVRKVVHLLKACRFPITGRGPPGEEFVSCGGIEIAEINLKTMESKLVKNFYLAGEVSH